MLFKFSKSTILFSFFYLKLKFFYKPRNYTNIAIISFCNIAVKLSKKFFCMF